MKNKTHNLPSPCWILDEKALLANLHTIERLKKKTNAKVLLALKGYALWKSFDIIKPYLDGCCASGLHEARLAYETFGKEVHTYSPAFKGEEIKKIASISHHLIFNSPAQLMRFYDMAKETNPDLSIGLRINPEYSAAPTDLYNPCAPFSRLGTTKANFYDSIVPYLEGLHFHALCEESAESLKGVLMAFESKFGDFIPKMKWINFGGGHHITKEGYDLKLLTELIISFKERYGVDVYLEPGEAIGWQTGVLMATVIDIVENGIPIAILDTSAEAHMPDTIIMPYKAKVLGAGEPHEKPYTYRLGGNTCLAGDVMGDYSFDEPLKIGDKIYFEDQMHYTMVKATTFNGIKLPAIAIKRRDGSVDVVREFGFEEYKRRLS